MIRSALPSNRTSVEALLRAAKLPIEGVEDHFESFFVIEDGGRVVAAVGLEWYGDAALLRSAVVAAEQHGRGLGSLLTRRALDEARAKRARAVFLLTTTAETFFPRFGFERIDREDVPLAMRASRELQGVCPTSAITMRVALCA